MESPLPSQLHRAFLLAYLVYFLSVKTILDLQFIGRSIMGFLARERFCDMDAQPNSVARGAFDQDVLASPVRALAQIGTALVGFRLNLIAYLSRANKRESFRMGSSSNAEPMREGSM
ncbi:LOW QUALITY PROTEIN: hypothetical protein V2J09_012256 [Rumex salicifolius]